ncbi:flagellar basal body L-ring protein FlgH [Limoniibacter endophyticus]|uniref:Flagellar L-ring protein n=1 Tax=Limoniibacter endophyticus TaxID=1565040 RepID=A0A8J3DMD8_9HYPH|nr:flagellar basal body L-ring protein FlgH [Limoniibacter endophyticus]GHC64550.1 flagellar L-ring protein [Limoniibacter endophyticus]
MNRVLIAALACTALAGCTTPNREIGRTPALSPVGSGAVPTVNSVYSYPKPPAPRSNNFSLWTDKQSRFFTDARALEVGDILTVLISINDRANFKNESERDRMSSKNLGLGLGGSWIGSGIAGSLDADMSSDTASKGTGEIKRSETLDLQVAAVVTEVLPNGNLLIQGSQEVRVNAEMRVLTIAGIVRPTDIGGRNTIAYERIAEARISYGGTGRLTEVQQPPYGQQFLDNVLPF